MTTADKQARIKYVRNEILQLQDMRQQAMTRAKHAQLEADNLQRRIEGLEREIQLYETVAQT